MSNENGVSKKFNVSDEFVNIIEHMLPSIIQQKRIAKQVNPYANLVGSPSCMPNVTQGPFKKYVNDITDVLVLASSHSNTLDELGYVTAMLLKHEDIELVDGYCKDNKLTLEFSKVSFNLSVEDLIVLKLQSMTSVPPFYNGQTNGYFTPSPFQQCGKPMKFQENFEGFGACQQPVALDADYLRILCKNVTKSTTIKELDEYISKYNNDSINRRDQASLCKRSGDGYTTSVTDFEIHLLIGDPVRSDILICVVELDGDNIVRVISCVRNN